MFSNKLIRETQVDNGRTIRVYDDVFDMEYRHSLYSFVQSSTFRIGWADSLTPENRQYQNIHSNYSTEDVERLGILDRLASTPAAQELEVHPEPVHSLGC